MQCNLFFLFYTRILSTTLFKKKGEKLIFVFTQLNIFSQTVKYISLAYTYIYHTDIFSM